MGTRLSRIRFENVSKLFPRGNGAVTALEEVSFEVADQEFVTIVGPSGCGKTTLMRMVAGLETPTLGSVLVGDRPVRGPGPDRAVVFQQFALFRLGLPTPTPQSILRCSAPMWNGGSSIYAITVRCSLVRRRQ